MTQVPNYSRSPAAVPVVPEDASTPDSPAEERTAPTADPEIATEARQFAADLEEASKLSRPALVVRHTRVLSLLRAVWASRREWQDEAHAAHRKDRGMTDRDDLATILREHAMPSREFDYPADEYECCADAILAAGWRSPAMSITSVEDLDALPVDTVVIEEGMADDRLPRAIVWQRIALDDLMCWASPIRSGWRYSTEIVLPVRVLWSPFESEESHVR